MLANVSVLPPAQDIRQPIRFDIERAVQVVRPGRSFGKLGVMTLFEALQIGVSSPHVGDARDPQFLDQTDLAASDWPVLRGPWPGSN